MNRPKLLRAQVLLLSLSILALTACGTYSTQGHKQSSVSLTGATTFGSATPNNPLPTTSPSPATSAVQTGLPAYLFDIHGVGYTSQSVSVQARSTLKVKFTPGVQD